MSKLYHFFARRLFWLALIGLVVMLFAQLFGRMVWQLELFSHYVPHLAGVLLIAVLIYPQSHLAKSVLFNKVALLVRLGFAGVAIGLFMWCIQPIHLWLDDLPNISDSTIQDKTNLSSITIAYQNVNIRNRIPSKATTELTAIGADKSPDVLILIEAGGSNWENELARLASDYPTHCGVNESSPFSMQVSSKAGQATCTILNLDEFPLARLQLPDGKTIYAAHPPPPINHDLAQARNRYLNELAKIIRMDSSDEVMVVGDFNLSAFSPIYRDFIEHSTISDSKHDGGGQTLQRTTPNGLPTWLPYGIGIDHVLVNKVSSTGAENDINPVSTQPMGWYGSDHRGFWITWRND